MYGQRYNLFDLWQKFIWFEKIFIWSKDILFESNKFCFIKKKISLHQRKCFKQIIFFIQSNIFAECRFDHWIKFFFSFRDTFLCLDSCYKLNLWIANLTNFQRVGEDKVYENDFYSKYFVLSFFCYLMCVLITLNDVCFSLKVCKMILWDINFNYVFIPWLSSTIALRL